jgi:hypothetical protein
MSNYHSQAERSRSGDSRRAKKWAAGGQSRAEVNGVRSEAQWNPVSIVALACEKV